MKLLLGDCKEKLKELEDNSIDAIVTDPPYGLSFMGKKWDYDVPSIEVWQECLRVLKPGGYLLSFAGTRTQHRMAVNIEDAGFEIRDMIAWVYGCLSEDTEILTNGGWERYHKGIINHPVLCYNVGRNSFEFHKPIKDYFYENKYTAYRIKSDKTDQIVSRNHRVLVERNGRKVFITAEALQRQENIPILESLSDLPETIYDFQSHTGIKKQVLLSKVYKQSNKQGKYGKKTRENKMSKLWENVLSYWAKQKQPKKVLFQKLCRQSKRLVKRYRTFGQGGMDRKEYGKLSQKDDRRKQSCLEGWANIQESKRKICQSVYKICQVSKGVFRNGKARRLCNGTQIKNGSIFRKMFTKEGGNSSYQSQCDRQQDRKLDAISNKSGTQVIRSTRATVTPVEYRGNVWCVQVPTGAFVARRNGKIFITGNSGFPKSLNIGKAVDKLQGNERSIVGHSPYEGRRPNKFGGKENGDICYGDYKAQPEMLVDKGTSDWEGWGTALKPALEPITVARKPLGEKTVAENCLKWGVGGINIDGCRVEIDPIADASQLRTMNRSAKEEKNGWGMNQNAGDIPQVVSHTGRFPANLILSYPEDEYVIKSNISDKDILRIRNYFNGKKS